MAPSTGSGGRLVTAQRVANRVIVSTRYSHDNPMIGMSTPPSSGPTIAPAPNNVIDSELAAGSSSGSRILGSTALRVGWLTAKNACCSANSPSRSHTLRLPIAAWTKKSPVVTMRPHVVNVSSVRRSRASANAPP